jgi:hypothetical protein
MLFPKYDCFEKQYNNSSLKEYENFLHFELLRNKDEGRIENIAKFKEKSEKFWEKEKRNVEADIRIINLFVTNNSVLDDYMLIEKNTNMARGKQIQVLKNIHRQFLTYETVALENALAPNNLVSFQTFTKLPVFTKKEYTLINKGTKDEFPMKQWANIRYNKLVWETKDIYQRFFTSIPGLREEVNRVLSKIVLINVPDVFDNDQQRWCQSFGSHHIFRLYARKVEQCIQRIKDNLENNPTPRHYQCVCGSLLNKKNRAYHEQISLRHKNYLKYQQNSSNQQSSNHQCFKLN